MREFLSAYGVGLHETPAVLQLNSFTREYQPDEAAQIAAALDLSMLTTCRTNAASGEGLLEALTTLSRQVLDRVTAKDQQDEQANHSEKPTIVITPKDTDSADVPHSDTQEGSELFLPAQGADKPLVTLLSNDLTVEGTTFRIPLEIQCGNTRNRLVVTVSIASE